ncbi:IQ domain-containing protein E isoform X1 [Erpetoichthys calabaricus]|uniref:IQ domain-containing protein E isoform X1 n=1 Tax=Erpetoichthys calabaricus TaxID=27687 RepID=UPI0022346B5C|nr:IQ domain-containing protein E isoform X1 [Erpetoichthys calabaricus]
MSVTASDFITDEELEELGEDVLSVATYESDTDKKPKKKKNLHKPPRSPKSPYLSNTYQHPKKAAVWRSLKGSGSMHLENPSSRTPRELWLASLKNGFATAQPVKAEYDYTQARLVASSSTPEYLKEALGMKKPKHSRSASTGYVPGTPDYKEKEDMYDEIIELKKTLQAQKSEADLMKTKLRRLEEDNSKKEKQIEQLLDPTKGSDFTRSLVDKRNDASAITNGLKQKILKLEQQCKEKDNVINKLQTDLKTTNIEEMKIAMETYYDEIQRLRVLLANTESAEKKSEFKDSEKQQKLLNTTILRLSKNIKQLQEENKSLKVDLEKALDKARPNTSRDNNELNKQRSIKRVVELEKKGDQTNPNISNAGDRTTVTNAVVTVVDQPSQLNSSTCKGTDFQQECTRLRGLVSKLKEDRSDLQEQLSGKVLEIKQLTNEKAELIKENQKLKLAHQKLTQESKEEIRKLTERVKRSEAEVKEERRVKEESLLVTSKDRSRSVSPAANSLHGYSEDQRDDSFRSSSARTRQQKPDKKQEKAARTIQKHWHEDKDKAYEDEEDNDDGTEAAIFIQSAFRGHLTRQKQLGSIKGTTEKQPQRPQNKSPRTLQHQSDRISSQSEEDNEETVTLLQSALRGHLCRSRQLTNRASDSDMPGRNGRKSPSLSRNEIQKPSPTPQKRNSLTSSYKIKETALSESDEDDDLSEISSRDNHGNKIWSTKGTPRNSSPSNRRPSPAPRNIQKQSRSDPTLPSKDDVSDDSDDIIVSPVRPLKRRDSYF